MQVPPPVPAKKVQKKSIFFFAHSIQYALKRVQTNFQLILTNNEVGEVFEVWVFLYNTWQFWLRIFEISLFLKN